MHAFAPTRDGRLLAGVLVTAALANGCGSDGSGPPQPMSPTPPVATRAFVHVLGAPRGLSAPPRWETARYSFEVIPPAGSLRLLVSESLGRTCLVAADPRGRFLFLVAGTSLDLLQCHAFDPGTGALRMVSNLRLPSYSSAPPSPRVLGVNESRVLAARGSDQGTYVYDLDDSTCALSPGPRVAYESWSDGPTWFVLPPLSQFVYRDDGGKGIVVLAPEDGHLTAISTVRTPGDSGIAHDAAYTNGCLVATFRTGVTAAGAASGGIVSYTVDATTGRLAQSGTVEGFVARHVAAAAGRVAATTSTRLLTFELDHACRITAAAGADIDGPAKDDYYAGSLAFHPSGDFLYVDELDGLHSYMFVGQRSIVPLETFGGVRGRVVAAPPPS